MSANPLNNNYPRVNPFLMVTDINKEVQFLKSVFDARETERIQLPDGTPKHVEMRVGESVIMIGQGDENMGNQSMIYIYMEDTTATYEKALAAGAKPIMPPAEQYYGDINAGVQDEFGHFWWIATHVEDMSEEEMNRRAAEFEKNQS